jgi:hypothetical protein
MALSRPPVTNVDCSRLPLIVSPVKIPQAILALSSTCCVMSA